MTDSGQISQRKHKPNFSRTRQRHDVPDSPLLEQVQKWILHHNLELVHGPGQVSYEANELIVLAVMRDARAYVRSFMEHYRSLGAKHVVFLDNGSTDGTVEALVEYENVTVLRTRLPFNRYGISMRQYLVERFGRNRWTLNVDIDELFVYPYLDILGLESLLKYLNDNSYTAVVANMLDMFPEKPLSEVESGEDEPLKELHRFYDVSNIRTQDYGLAGDVGNELSNPDVTIFRDGIRQTLFNVPTLLIKHPLVFLDNKVKPMDLSEHWATNARVADFTGALLHYKLMDRLFEMVRKEIKARSYPNRWGKYDNYLGALEAAPSLQIKAETARELESVDELVANRFVVVSREYMKLVERESSKNGTLPEEHSERLLEAFLGAIAELKTQNQKFGDIWQELGVEQLREQVRTAHKKNREFQQKANRHEQRSTRLSTDLEEVTRRNQSLHQQLGRLQQQLKSMRRSRIWRLISSINRVRTKFLK